MKLKPLALAVGVALPVAAAASTITVTPSTVSSEYMALFGGIVAPAATVALGAQYAVGDIITFTYSGAAKANTGTTAFSFDTTLPINTTDASNTSGALALFDSGDTSVSYRVTTAPAGDEFGQITLPTPFFRTADVGGADVTMSTSSATSQGLSFDSGSSKTLIDQTGTQFAYRVSGLSQVIDVESARRAFVNGTATAASHSIVVTQVTNATSAGNTVAPTNVVTASTIAVTLTGDFSWLDSSTATGIQATNISGATVAGASATTIVMVIPAGGATITVGNAPTTGAIPTQSLAAAFSGSYVGNSTSGFASGSATGAYTLNGSSVTVYAVPTAAAASNFIWLTNSGANDGEVTIVVNDNGTEIDLGVVGTSEGGQEFDVSKAMNTALEAAGKTLSGGRVHLDIVTKVPAADVAISAAYKIGDDRVNLLTSLETDND